jgi:hypothetical protein
MYELVFVVFFFFFLLLAMREIRERGVCCWRRCGMARGNGSYLYRLENDAGVPCV